MKLVSCLKTYGEAEVVMQDVDSYKKAQEAMAMLKILALGSRQINGGRVTPVSEVIEKLRQYD